MDRRLSRQQACLLEAMASGCVECGEADVRTLQFDHVPERGIKRFKITANLYKPWATFKEELAKCDMVCANCHAKRTYDRALLDGKLPFREALRTGQRPSRREDFASGGESWEA